jgi:hypothetical protein
MDKRDKIMMELLTSQINFYSGVLAQTRNLPIHRHNLRLASVTRRASRGLSGLVDQLSFQQDIIMKRNGAVHIPIKFNRKHYETYSRSLHTKNNSSL